MLDTLKKRRSCRAYDGNKVTNEEMDKVIEAGLWAPTGMNRQRVMLVGVQDAECVALLSKLNAEVMGNDSDPFYGAKSVIIVFADATVNTWVEDGALAMGNMLNEAEALGLGACWIHRAREVFDAPEGRKLADKWGVPKEYRGVGNCILGYKTAEIPARRRADGRVLKVGY